MLVERSQTAAPKARLTARVGPQVRRGSCSALAWPSVMQLLSKSSGSAALPCPSRPPSSLPPALFSPSSPPAIFSNGVHELNESPLAISCANSNPDYQRFLQIPGIGPVCRKAENQIDRAY